MAEIIDEDFTVSFVTYIEFLGYQSVSKTTEEFMALASVIEIDKDIIDTCIALRKSKSIKLPDAIIASTAISRGRSLTTRNVGDFKKISDLEVVTCMSCNHEPTITKNWKNDWTRTNWKPQG